MDVHEKFMNKSIDLNIIGTANITKICSDLNIKLIYFSTSYVYPGIKGNYDENDPMLPKIIILGQNWVEKVQYKCIKIH